MATVKPAAARYVGKSVERKEDKRLLTGHGKYVDDIVVPGMLHVAFHRSPLARAKIKSIDVAAAAALTGVHAVYTGKDINKGLTPIGGMFSSLRDPSVPAPPSPKVYPMADGDVRFAGDPIALIIADDRYIAEDASELIEVDYEMLDPIIDCAGARDGMPIHPELENNIISQGASPEDPELDAAFASAAHVVTDTLRQQRHAAVPMETRGLVVSPTGMDEITIWLSCQSSQQQARYIADTLGLAHNQVRVIAGDVGGGFGLKAAVNRDELAVVVAARLFGGPLKWIEDRLENLTAGCHAREETSTLKLAFDADARLLAIHQDYEDNSGAYPIVPGGGGGMHPPYRLPHYGVRASSYYTNTCGKTAYRGPWMMETLVRETMMDVAARQMGIDPLELRRRNVLTAADQPYTTPLGDVYEGVTPQETLEQAAAILDVPAFRAEQQEARKAGRYLGLGMSVYIEPTAMAMAFMSTEVAEISIEPTGKVIAKMSTQSQGHGTETTMAQVIADELGVDFADVTVMEGDSQNSGFGFGAGGSRQALIGGGAAIGAAKMLREKVLTIASHMIEAAPEDLAIESGRVSVEGVPGMGLDLGDIAKTAYYAPDNLPGGMEPGLEARHRFRPPPVTFANAAHMCTVEVDIETGFVKILRWVSSEDCGVMINPAVVAGQIAGGVVQGIGGVLLEHAPYDEMGNPLGATFKDYLMPLITDVPRIEYGHMSTPSTTPGGFKGVGEGGAIIAPSTLINAINDALSPLGVTCLDLPLSPNTILTAVEAAKAG